MSAPFKLLAVVAALALTYYVFYFMATEAEGSGTGDVPATTSVTLDALIALWAGTYRVDPKAVRAIILQEQFTGQGVVTISPPASAWPIGDSGTSFGPMQIHKGGLSDASPGAGAIDDWEAANGSVADSSADSSGPYDYLSAVGNSLALRIGVWNLGRCIKSAGGINALAFAKYNAGLGCTDVTRSTQDPQTGAYYGDEAFANYQTMAGTGPAVASADDDTSDDAVTA